MTELAIMLGRGKASRIAEARSELATALALAEHVGGESAFDATTHRVFADLKRRAAPLLARASSPTEIATRGVAGPGSALPHRDQIQASFGRHDVAKVVAHRDADAADASRALGAAAYAIGEDIAFASDPDLHTAAHEAAHVIQQRGGVHLAGGMGARGDTYERHADEVADAVVSGRSAEALLDRVAAASTAGVAVQRQEAGSVRAAPTSAVEKRLETDLPTIFARAKEATELVDLLRTALLPAFRRAVDALDPLPALELARHCVGSVEVIKKAAKLVESTVADPALVVEGDDRRTLDSFRLQLLQYFPRFEIELAVQLSPQIFRGQVVLASVAAHVSPVHAASRVRPAPPSSWFR